MSNTIVIGGGEKDYWARIEDGVVVWVYPVDQNPKEYAFGANTDVIPILKKRFTSSTFVKLSTPRIHGVGWRYDEKTKEFSPPEEVEVEAAPLSREDVLRQELKAELMAEIMQELGISPEEKK